MYKLFNSLMATWSAIAEEGQRRYRPTDIIENKKSCIYYIAGVNQAFLWRGTYKEGDKNMIMEIWMRDPISYKMEWKVGRRGEWLEDKEYGTKEVTIFEAESKFPGSSRAPIK